MLPNSRETADLVTFTRAILNGNFIICALLFNFVNLKNGNSYIPISLLLIITLCFTCGKRETCSIIKKFQIIMNMIVCEIFVCFYIFINSFNC